MGSEIFNAMKISATAMRAQGARVRVITENLANADTAGQTPGADPYRRQTVSFKSVMDQEIGANIVKIGKIGRDMDTPFPVKYMPDHPAANEFGYVKMPNINTMLEVMDAREAQRSYEANLGMIEQARSMALRTIDLLRG